MVGKSTLSRVLMVTLALAGFVLAVSLSTRSVSGGYSNDSPTLIARGGGTTIIHGGTGSPNFTPVTTTLAFHAESSEGGTAGEFECLALAPEAAMGSHSGQFTVNAMYVAGKVTGASVNQGTATLTGVAEITGLGAGSDVPFTFVVHRGGPGTAATLTVNTLASPFNEILVQGFVDVQGGN
jgi:hypothetical protein